MKYVFLSNILTYKKNYALSVIRVRTCIGLEEREKYYGKKRERKRERESKREREGEEKRREREI